MLRRLARPNRTTATCDLCVVGAGMAGLAAAHEAAARGASVIVLEATHRPGGRVRTVRPAWAARATVECGPEFVDANHILLRDACARAGVTLRRVGGELHTYRDGVLAPSGRNGAIDPADVRLQQAYWAHIAEVASGIADPDRPNDHAEAAALDAEPISAVFAAIAAAVDAPPSARAQLGRFIQGVLGAEPDQVSALFVAQQAALDGSDASSRVEEGLGAVAAHLASSLRAPNEVRFGSPVAHIAHRGGGSPVEIRTRTGDVVHAAAVVLAVPLPVLVRLDVSPALTDAWLRAASELRYGSLVKATIAAPGVVIPGWAVASDLPTALVWQPGPGLATTYTGGARADRLAALAPSDLVAQAAADVGAITGRSIVPVGGTWRWTPSSRRGGCYVVFGPGQVGAHWDSLRRRIGPFALAGEHCGRFTGYVEGAMQAGVRAASQLLV